MNRLLLIDGHNLMFQMFYGMPSRIVNHDGVGIWGVIGFVGALRKIINITSPTHLAVLFDGDHENKRAEINSEYKTNRVDYSVLPDEESPFTQLPMIFSALEYLGIPYAETTDCEVDDWMAGYAAQTDDEDELIISSFDSDFFQLISDNISVLRYRGDNTVICNIEYVFEKFGVMPNRYADLKALVGDKADCISGAENIGIKTAADLLKAYDSLDGVISNYRNISKRSVRDSVERNREKLNKNYSIIKLDGTAILPIPISDMKYTGTLQSTNEVLRAIGLIL